MQIEISLRHKLEYFHIVLEKTNGVYFPGEILSGSVNLKVNERVKIKGLSIQIEGSTRVGKK